MSQIETYKLTQYAALAPDSDEIAVHKLVMFVLLTPGDGGVDTSNRQGHCYVQIVEN